MSTATFSLPRVALVGRRNVGKSTLLNAFCGRRHAITNDTPGLTRDILEIEIRHENCHFLLSDTPGLDVENPNNLEEKILTRAKQYLSHLDLILFVLAAPEPHSFDLDFIEFMRKSSSRIPKIYLVNKIDNREIADQALIPFYEAKLTSLVPISAKGRWNLDTLLLRMKEVCGRIQENVDSSEKKAKLSLASPFENHHPRKPRTNVSDDPSLKFGVHLSEPSPRAPRPELALCADNEAEAEVDTSAIPVNELRLAIVGRPNVGKSSLFNSILGQDRALVSEIPGTTRDTVDTLFYYGKRPIRIMDTAGMRRPTRLLDARHKVEFYSLSRTKRAIQSARVIIQLIDGLTGLTDLDKRICSMLEKYQRAVLLTVSKWDILKSLYDPQEVRREFEDRLSFLFPHVRNLPLVFCSSVSRHGIKKILDTCLELDQSMQTNISTGELNRYMGKWQKARPLNSSRFKLFYAVQVGSAPPSFSFFVNDPKLFTSSLRSYFENCIRRQYKLVGIPIKIYLRERTSSSRT